METREAASGDVALANALRNIATIEQHAVAFRLGLEFDHGVGGQSAQGLRIVERDLLLQRLEGEGAIHGSALEIDVAQLFREAGGDGALARSGGAVDGDDQFAGGAHSLLLS